MLTVRPALAVDVGAGVYADADDGAAPGAGTVPLVRHLAHCDPGNDYQAHAAEDRLDRICWTGRATRLRMDGVLLGRLTTQLEVEEAWRITAVEMTALDVWQMSNGAVIVEW